MQKRLIATVVIFLAWYSIILACSCFGPSDFCTTMNRPGYEADLMVKCVKLTQEYHGMKIKIVDVISGDPGSDTIMVWGDNGALCRVYTSLFNISDTLILALNYTDKAGNYFNTGFPDSLEQDSDFLLSACGVYFLTVEGNRVTGPITPTDDTLSYDDFKSLVSSDCLVDGIGNKNKKEFNWILYPNPAKNKIRLKFKDSYSRGTIITIHNLLGIEVYRVSLSAKNEQNSILINTSSMQPGLYVIEVLNSFKKSIKHLTIQ